MRPEIPFGIESKHLYLLVIWSAIQHIRHMLACMTANIYPDNEPSRGRRISSRLRLNIPARLVLVSGNFDCLLNDISVRGARVSLAEPPRSSNSALLQFRQLEIFCDVVWSHADQSGLRFADALSTEILIELRGIADNFSAQDRFEKARRIQDWVSGRIRIL